MLVGYRANMTSLKQYKVRLLILLLHTPPIGLKHRSVNSKGPETPCFFVVVKYGAKSQLITLIIGSKPINGITLKGERTLARARYEEWLTPEGLLKIQGWKRAGLTDEQIANNIGVTARTFEKWKANHVQIRQVIKNSKENANFVIENALFKKAKDGNTTAQIFWLKNNYRSKYSDKSQEELDLIKQKVRSAKLEADLLEAKVKLINGDMGEDRTVIIDDIPKND